MRTKHRFAAAAFLLFLLATAVPLCAQTTWPKVSLSSPIGGFARPVHITHAGDGSGRLFVVERSGRIRIVKDGAVMDEPFLDISNRSAIGMHGVAFPPGYASKGYFYVKYDATDCSVVVARFHLTADANVADAASEEIVLSIPSAEPAAPGQCGHSGSQPVFNPRDGYLYLAMGDGSVAETIGDPENLAQNPEQLWGKMLRIDVETGRPATYTIPATNPYVGLPGYRSEIWAIGLRNPWRISFDRQTDDLLIADVGQDQYEEVSFQPADSAGGANYGWRIMEGTHCYNPSMCDPAGLTLPVIEYDHTQGCSITGGHVYRGAEYSSMQGIYFYADFCAGSIWGAKPAAAPATTAIASWQSAMLLNANFKITSFGEGEDSSLYVINYDDGIIYEIIETPPVQIDLSITKTAASDSTLLGNTLTYTIRVTNNSAETATGVTVTDTLPASVKFDTAASSQGTCSGVGIVSCDLGELAGGGATATVTIVVTTTAAGVITNKANVTGREVDPNTANNSVSHSTRVVKLTQLTVSSSISGCGTVAGKVALSGPAPTGGAVVALSNTNPAAAAPASVTIPAGLTSQSFTIMTMMVSGEQTGSVMATLGPVLLTKPLKVTPSGAYAVTLSPTSVKGGGDGTSTGTVTLKCAAAPGGVTVALSSGNAALAAPTANTLTIAEASTAGTFSVNTSAVTRRTSVVIKAAIGRYTRSATLVINP